MDPDFVNWVKCIILWHIADLGVYFDLYVADFPKSTLKYFLKLCTCYAIVLNWKFSFSTFFENLPQTNQNIPSNLYSAKIWCILLQQWIQGPNFKFGTMGCKKDSTFWYIWHIQIKIYPQTSIVLKYESIYSNKKVRVQTLSLTLWLLLVQLKWRVAPP